MIVIDAYPDFRHSPVNLWFNIKQTAISTMVAFVVSTICLHYKNRSSLKFTSRNIVISDDNDKWLKAAAGQFIRIM